MGSRVPVHDHARDRGEELAPGPEGGHGVERILAQRGREASGRVQAVHAHVRGLLRRLVLSRGLAQVRRVLRRVEHVVHDLEGEADRGGVAREALQARPVGTAEDRPAANAGREERPRLRPVQALEGPGIDRAPLRLEVRHLPPDEAGRAAGLAEDGGGAHAAAQTRLVTPVRPLGHEVEGTRQERVSGEDRDRLAEDLVRGRLAAPEVVVVHGRQVVVDQAVRVDHLHRAGERHEVGAGAAHGLAGGDHERGPDALAPREQAVADRAVDRGRPRRLGREGPVECFVHLLADRRERSRGVAPSGRDVGAHGRSSSSGRAMGLVRGVP
jgi:hypothetical protein